MSVRREANFGVLFRHWIRANKDIFESCAIELKQTTTDSIPFSDVQDHQIAALSAASEDGILYKIPDDSRGIKPFDMVYLRRSDAYIVIRYPVFFVVIALEDFLNERKSSKRKSLTASRATDIAQYVVTL